MPDPRQNSEKNLRVQREVVAGFHRRHHQPLTVSARYDSLEIEPRAEERHEREYFASKRFTEQPPCVMNVR